MGDSTPSRVPETGRSGWTPEILLDHVLAIISEKHVTVMTQIEGNDRRYEERFNASQQALQLGLSGQKAEISAALAAADRAVSKAEVAAEKRFEGVNEFRAQLGDQQRTLMPRIEAENRLAAMAEKVAVLEQFRTEVLSRGAGSKDGYALAISIASFVAILLAIVAAVALRFNG